mgnify:CR=1 FL=1
MNTDLLADITHALAALCEPSSDAARALLKLLGYSGTRTFPLSNLDDFLEAFDPDGELRTRRKAFLEEWRSIDLLFQLTDDDLSGEGILFTETHVDKGLMNSYLFFHVVLKGDSYPRSKLAQITRQINRLFHVPVMVLFSYGGTLSIAVINRRRSKVDASKDVLGKVTLIHDIRCADPHRGHRDILASLAVRNLVHPQRLPITNFDTLHAAWEEIFNVELLNKRFYRELSDWYFWAHHLIKDGTIRLPQHCDTEQEKSLFLIRLLTRVIFCWFLVEKRLIPADLFLDHKLKKLVKDLSPDTSTYYHAVLQNLFFGTLNMPGELRGFREKKKDGQRYDPNYGTTNLWRYETDFHDPDDWLKLAEHIPFLNGGLFDCLDDKSGKRQDNSILDGFSDNPKLACHLPNDLFFGSERSVDLSKDYGEENKRTARSKRAKVRGLIEILSSYKFTIEENTPLEEEIALDPELLGKVFENLLASYNEDTKTTARKALGAFYTPREIVAYMVDEALKSYLSTQVPKAKGVLDSLFANTANPSDIKPDLRDALIAAIGHVKILDPACGSGAFPMGALNRLVDLLQKLDPNNELWKRDRLAEAERYLQVLEATEAPKEEIEACHDRIEDITRSFDTRFHALDFARKLYLVENAIYGVDIQPIAVQIAKLRFFISLVVDQKVDMQAKNLGVRPLPNLETRLVAADTLIPLPKPKAHQGNLFDDATPEDYKEHSRLKKELQRIRHEHFNARDPRKKRRLRDDDARVRGELQVLLQKVGLPAKAARAMSAWDPYDQNTAATFFDSEWMFGLPVGKVRVPRNAPSTLLGNLALVNDAGGQMEFTESDFQEVESGFDIVIGNPPYIRIQTLKKKDPKLVEFYRKEYNSATKGNYDLYVVFIEAGLRFLRSDGHLAYICPHKFFNAQYGEPLRKLIARGNNLRHVVHFGDEQVFPGATIYTCLLFLSKNANPYCSFVKAHNLAEWGANHTGAAGKIPSQDISSTEWNFAVGHGADLFGKMRDSFRKLGDVADVFVGIQTSADDVFILDLIETKQTTLLVRSRTLQKAIELEHDLMHPIVSGTDVKHFAPLPDRQYILFPYMVENERASLIPFTELEAKYKLTALYLKNNQQKLKRREKGKFNDSEWHRFGRSQNLGIQSRPKLCVPRLVDHLHAGIDLEGTHYLDNVDVGGVTWKPEFSGLSLRTLLSLFNSQVLRWYFPHVSAPFRGGYRSANRQFINQLPICNFDAQQSLLIDRLVNYLLCINTQGNDPLADQSTRDPLMLAYFERIMNGLVYELYFPEEVHGAGLHLFDAVAEAKLPDIETIPEEERLSRLRTLFETLYDSTHPLRIALDKLQTLDTVRIIEGKA